jgi:putative transcriptional regulator
MKPAHHLDDATLLSYASGALPTALGVVTSVHLGGCESCRAQLAFVERVGSVLVEQQAPAEAAADARAAMLARLGEKPEPPARLASPIALAADAGDALPLALHPYFGPAYSKLRWRFIAPGVHIIRSRDVTDSSLLLLRTGPGRSVPEHSHQGSELTQILRGAYDDALGHFGPGDIADLDSDITHQPVTAPGEPCICLAATDAPLRFQGWMARALQPLIGL